MTSVAIVGSTGTMGRLVRRVVDGLDDFEVVAGLDSRSDRDEMLAADLVVDVSLPAVSPDVVEHAVAAGRKVLVGTSGWSAERLARLRRRVSEVEGAGAVVVPNFSLGSVLATRLAEIAARHFDSIEIVEAHHDGKVDSPSGTAVRTAEAMAAARGSLGPVASPHADQRARGQSVGGIAVHSLRMRGVRARQDVVFGGAGEIVTISHETLDEQSYAPGIVLGLRAARDSVGLIVGLDALIDL